MAHETYSKYKAHHVFGNSAARAGLFVLDRLVDAGGTIDKADLVGLGGRSRFTISRSIKWLVDKGLAAADRHTVTLQPDWEERIARMPAARKNQMSFDQVLAAYPDLTSIGFVDDSPNKQMWREQLEQSQADFDYCLQWLARWLTGADNFTRTPHSCYELKHIAEHGAPTGYLYNGTFAAAVISRGYYKWRRIDGTAYIEVAITEHSYKEAVKRGEQ